MLAKGGKEGEGRKEENVPQYNIKTLDNET